MKLSFRKTIYAIVSRIPIGNVATYGQLAKMAGSPYAARAVGMAMKCNPDRHVVPCHRVVASNGALIGYAFGKGVITKRRLLEKEGVSFIGDRVNLAISQWEGV